MIFGFAVMLNLVYMVSAKLEYYCSVKPIFPEFVTTVKKCFYPRQAFGVNFKN